MISYPETLMGGSLGERYPKKDLVDSIARHVAAVNEKILNPRMNAFWEVQPGRGCLDPGAGVSCLRDDPV